MNSSAGNEANPAKSPNRKTGGIKMKRKALAAIMAVAMAVSMAGCGGSPSESKDSTQKTETADSTASTGGSVENKDKPLCWFNRQPSSSATGELDKDALNFNGNTYYVGFDANQGAELQGQMVLDYIKKNPGTISIFTVEECFFAATISSIYLRIYLYTSSSESPAAMKLL